MTVVSDTDLVAKNDYLRGLGLSSTTCALMGKLTSLDNKSMNFFYKTPNEIDRMSKNLNRNYLTKWR